MPIPEPTHLSPHHKPLIPHKLLHLTRVLHTLFTFLGLLPLLFVALTGLLLNHQDSLGIFSQRESNATVSIPPALLAGGDKLALVEHLRNAHGATGAVEPFEFSDTPLRLTFKSPGSVRDFTIQGDGQATVATSSFGLTGVLSRLHKNKDAGRWWFLLLDTTAILLALSCLTGIILWLALPHRRRLGLIGLLAAVLGMGAAIALLP